MARAIREYQIRPMVCDWALDIPMGNTTFVLHFNSRNNAELVKAILEWEDSHPNEAIPYQPTLTPPNDALTLEQLQEMDGEPIYSGKYKRWFLVTYFAVLNRSQLMDSTGTPFVADDCGPLYLCPPEGEEN